MAEVRWSLIATNDLEELENFISRDSILYAIHFLDRIVESTEKLEGLPQLGRVVPEFGRVDIRELLFRGYRVVYLLES
jgi:toxin ParE1/3/4